ncbi:MAG: helix-turn-helix domain-containing protein [Acidiferrobacterales bacterium]|nr:helix-turn-helix domain-containing protein [Acidiferrobacterales bacterium]
MRLKSEQGPLFTIGKLARNTGVKVPTIRYYESEGLIAAVARSEGNQRLYSEKEESRLNFIRHGRELGFTLDDVRDLISLQQGSDESCLDAHRIVNEQLLSIRSRLQRLSSLESELKRIAKLQDPGSCKNCKVIESLSDHSLCESNHHD